MGFDQYHELPQELAQEVRTFVWTIKSFIEETKSIDWFEQHWANLTYSSSTYPGVASIALPIAMLSAVSFSESLCTQRRRDPRFINLISWGGSNDSFAPGFSDPAKAKLFTT